MSDLKKSWQQTAKSFILAINDLSASVVDTAKAGYDVAMEWAKKDNIHVQADGTEVPSDDVNYEEPVAEASAEAETATD